MPHYTINVALNGRHYFATAEHSITTEDRCITIAQEIQKRFPVSEGFSISVSFNPQRESFIDITNKTIPLQLIKSIGSLPF